MTEKIDFATAMRTQPASLRTARTALIDALGAADLAPWRDGETVAVVAMGASNHSAEALMAVLRRAGVRAVNVTASDLAAVPNGFQAGDHYIFVSESGRSPEPVRAAERCRRGRRIAITNDPNSPLAHAVDVVLPLGGFADSRVYTGGYTATLLAYDLLLRRQLEAVRDEPRLDAPGLVDTVTTDLASTVAHGAQQLSAAKAIDVVGCDVSLAAAEEGALVLREAARVHATAFETYQYLHGPMEPLGGESGVVVFGDGRELPMVSMILEHQVPVVLVTKGSQGELPSGGCLGVIRLPGDVSGFGRAIAEAVVMQMLAAEIATCRGLDIDEFRFDQPDTKIAVPAG